MAFPNDMKDRIQLCIAAISAMPRAIRPAQTSRAAHDFGRIRSDLQMHETDQLPAGDLGSALSSDLDGQVIASAEVPPPRAAGAGCRASSPIIPRSARNP